MGRNYNAEILTICICVQIKVRTICCEGRPSYPPLTSVTRHKFYGGFNSFRDDCYRFWSPQHPKHEQLHGGTRKQINFQAPVLALLVSFLQLHENTNPTSPGTLMTCLSCWVCSCAVAVLKLVRVKGRSVSSKNAGAELCVRGETCEVSATKMQPGAGTWHSDHSSEQLELSLRQCYPLSISRYLQCPQSVAMLCIVVSARRYESYPMVVANLSDWMCDGGLGDRGHWWWWLPQ